MADYFDSEEQKEIEEVKASIPLPSETESVSKENESNENETNENTSESKGINAENIEIANKNVIQYLVPRENKKTHFTLDENNEKKLTSTLKSILGNELTVVYADKKKDPGMTLLMDDEEVGKIHFLLCDAPNVNLPEKYYCKLFFYDFKDQDLYNKVKSTLINFFENFNGQNNTSGGKRVKRRITKRCVAKRKSKKGKTIKRSKRTAKRN